MCQAGVVVDDGALDTQLCHCSPQRGRGGKPRSWCQALWGHRRRRRQISGHQRGPQRILKHLIQPTKQFLDEVVFCTPSSFQEECDFLRVVLGGASQKVAVVRRFCRICFVYGATRPIGLLAGRSSPNLTRQGLLITMRDDCGNDDDDDVVYVLAG